MQLLGGFLHAQGLAHAHQVHLKRCQGNGPANAPIVVVGAHHRVHQASQTDAVAAHVGVGSGAPLILIAQIHGPCVGVTELEDMPYFEGLDLPQGAAALEADLLVPGEGDVGHILTREIPSEVPVEQVVFWTVGPVHEVVRPGHRIVHHHPDLPVGTDGRQVAGHQACSGQLLVAGLTIGGILEVRGQLLQAQIVVSPDDGHYQPLGGVVDQALGRPLFGHAQELR